MKAFCTFFLMLFSIFNTNYLCAAPPNDPQRISSCDIDLGPDVTVCTGAVFQLNPHPKSNSNYTWSGSIGLDCYNCPSPSFTGLGVGSYVYIATVTGPNCTASDTLRITVINGESPKYIIGEDQGICAGDSVFLGGPPVSGTNYSWSSNPAGFFSTSSNPGDKPAGPKTYYLTASNASCPLPVIDSVKIMPVTLVLQMITADTVKICQGKSRTFQVNINPLGHPITWEPMTGLQISSNGATAVATPLESTLYTATATLGGCTRQRQVFIAVDSLPNDLNIHPFDTTICQGQQARLGLADYGTAYPNINFRWSLQNGTLISDTSDFIVVQPLQTTIYRLITRNGVCADTAQAIVRVTPAAFLTASPTDTLVCPGEPVDLDLDYSPGVINILWTPSDGLSCINCDTPRLTPGLITTYIVTGNFQDCVVTDTVQINLKPAPPLKFPLDVQLCPGDFIQLNEDFDTATTYIWTSTHPGFGTKTIKNQELIYQPSQTADYFVQADNGSCIRKDTLRVFVSNATLTVTSSQDTICKNYSVLLTASPNLPGPIRWRNETTGQIIDSMVAITVTPSMTTTYTAIFTFGDSCQISESVTVTVDGEAPLIVFPTDTELCEDQTLVLNSGPVLPNSMYQWTANPPDPGLDALTPSPTVSPNQNTIYSVTAVDTSTSKNCSISRQLEVKKYYGTLNISADTTVCANSQARLIAIGTGTNGSYSWSSGEKSSEIFPKPDSPGIYIYTVTYLYGDGDTAYCKLTDSVEVAAVQSFNLSIDCFPDTNKIDIGTLLTLTAIVEPPQNLSNFQFEWEERTIDTKPLPFNSESIDVVPSSNDTSVRYNLIVTAPNGCAKAAFKEFTLIFPKVIFPNAFTPDGDGTNDVFEMVDKLKGLSVVERMEIFNRWGQKIYESVDPNAFWDGNIDGEPAPSDVYIYRVWWRRGDNSLQAQSKGELYLMR